MPLLFIKTKSNKIDDNIKQYCIDSNYKYFDYITRDNIVQFANDKINYEYSSLITNETNNIYGFMLGQIYDISEKKKELISKGHIFKTKSDIEFIIHLYEEYGTEALTKLNGRFIIFLIDNVKNERILVNDRYGFYTFYYTVHNQIYSFCNRAEFFLECIVNRELDQESVKEFFNFGFIIGNKTMFKNIRKIAPGTIIKFKNDEVIESNYWHWNKIQKKNIDTYEQAIEKLGKLWINSVKKIINKNDKFILPLSGGLDSRAILAAVDYLNLTHKIKHVFTMGTKECLDYYIASLAAKVAKVKHILIELTKDYWWENIKECIYNSMGGINIIHSHGISFKETDDLSSTYLNGFAGDLVLGGSFLDESLIKSDNENLYKYFFENTRKALGIRNTTLLKDMKINETIFKNSIQYNSTDYFFINSRVKNFTLLGGSLLGDRYHDVFPFFDNDLIDYIYSLPEEWRLQSKIYKDMLLKFFPKFFKNIPWQKTGVPIDNSYEFSKSNDLKDITINEMGIDDIQSNKRKAILFGASSMGQQAFEILKHFYNIEYFCDNDRNKWGHEMNGVSIISPNMLHAYKEHKIIITSSYHNEISIQLISMNIKNFKVYSRNFVDYGNWIRDINIKKQMYDILISKECETRGYYNMQELRRILDMHMYNVEDNINDIGLLLTFELFCRMFLKIQE